MRYSLLLAVEWPQIHHSHLSISKDGIMRELKFNKMWGARNAYE